MGKESGTGALVPLRCERYRGGLGDFYRVYKNRTDDAGAAGKKNLVCSGAVEGRKYHDLQADRIYSMKVNTGVQNA